MERLLDVVTLFSIALLVLVLASVRRAHIRVEYSVSWLIAGLVILILSRSSALIEWLAKSLGTDDPGVALLMIAGAVFLIVLYRLSLRISGLKDSNIKLAQRVAILEYRLESMSEKIKG